MKNKPRDALYCNVNKDKISKSIPRVNENNLRIFYHWINERYNIHLKKDLEKMPFPWTKDGILSKYRFTNVRREHDRETKWLIKNVCLNKKINYKNKLLNCILFRLFNKSKSLEIIGLIDFDRIDYNKINNRIKKFNSHKYFSNAFYTSGPKGAANKFFKDESNLVIKIIRLVESYKKNKIIYKINSAKSQIDAFNALKNNPGIGKFLAYQIFIDFTYIEEFPFSENEFVIAGPGCINGLNFIFEDFDGLNYEEALFWLRDNQNSILKKFNYNPKKLFSDLPEYERYLNLMSLENCMCEISKYIRALNGLGRPRIRYAPAGI